MVFNFAEEKKREMKKNKKKVKFAENVMVKLVERNSKVKNREEQGRQYRVSLSSSECRNEIPEKREMPANRIALYNGILKDRVHRMACCH